MIILENVILIPLLAGIVLFVVPEKLKGLKGFISLMVSAFTLYFSATLFFNEAIYGKIEITNLALDNFTNTSSLFDFSRNYLLFRVDHLSKLIVFFTGFFTFLITLYSLVFINKEKRFCHYYSYILLTLGTTNGVALVDNLVLFIVLWGFLGITLYKLIKGYDEESARAAKKTLILIGGADALMLAGIGLIWQNSGTLNISELAIPTNDALTTIAFLTLLIGSFTKAGAFPFHSWIPEFTKKAPAPSSAYLPASLDKLLGIYFMARLCNEMFVLNQWLTLIILIIGVSTIIIAVMMALIQHNYKKLLGYHAVSQVGYMVTGLGLGTTLGIIGGLFHMVNHALYKSGLFLAAGSVKKQTDKDDLDNLGGLSGKMPVTFITALIFALSISGIPPLNGFASKWIIYQGIIEFGREAGIANNLWMVWLALAVIGSALTLASFIKFISGIFLRKKKPELAAVKEAPLVMLVPMVIIALCCVGFGVLATSYVVPFFFEPIVGEASYIGQWSSVTVSILVLVSIVLGLIIYLLIASKKYRREESFIGGEKMQAFSSHAVSEFYDTIKMAPIFATIYRKAQANWFDLYHLSLEVLTWCNRLLSKPHNGILQNYALWLIAGLIIMLLFLT
ncbi:hypothetical protein DMA11_03415 [Marinilabiliaceae bacterium JC017]|nr:hypothetical protein DMA11_03415 [Marinilabiliaceae bacterium JC017]